MSKLCFCSKQVCYYLTAHGQHVIHQFFPETMIYFNYLVVTPKEQIEQFFFVGLGIFSVIYSGERSSFLFSPVERGGIFYEWKKFCAVTKLLPLLSVKMLFEQTILHGRFIQLWLIGLSLHRPPLQDQIPRCKPPPPRHQKHVSYYIL
jgi:hypothetical protein